MLGNSRLGAGKGVHTGTFGERSWLAPKHVLWLFILVSLLVGTAQGETTRTVRGGDPAGTLAFFDPPCGNSPLPPCSGSSNVTTITVGDMVRWDSDPTLALGVHASTEGDCGPLGMFNCPGLEMDFLHSVDHSGPSNGPGISSDHINVDTADPNLPNNDTQPWHFLPLPVTGVSPPTDRIQFIKAGTYSYFCFAHPDVMRGTIIVNKAGTTTGMSVSPGGSTTFGQAISFTVTVTSPLTGGAPAAVGPPTGTVEIREGAALVATGLLSPLISNPTLQSRVTINVSSFSVGSHVNITATYLGDGSFTGSTSGAISRTVVKATPGISVGSSQITSAFGQNVTFTATLTPTGTPPTAPTGTVSFLDNVSPLGSAPVSLNQASLGPINNLSVGSHPINASYGGDSNFNAVGPASVTQTVNQAATTTSVISSSPTIIATQSVTFTATVTPSGTPPINPSGTVTFRDGLTVIGGAAQALNQATGKASVTTSTLASGNRTISATYNADGNFTSSSGNVSQTVRDFQLTVSPGTNSASPGVPTQFTGTLSPIAAYNRLVNLSCSGTGGTTCSPLLSSATVPSSGSTTFTVNASNVAIGSYSVTITAADASIPALTHSQLVTLNVSDSVVNLHVDVTRSTSQPVLLGSIVRFDVAADNRIPACGTSLCDAHSITLNVAFSAPVFISSLNPTGNCAQSTATLVSCSFAGPLSPGNPLPAISMQLAAPLVRTLTATATVTSTDVENSGTLADNTDADNAEIRFRPLATHGLPCPPCK